MATFDVNEHPHNRYNPLLDEWVLVSPHRTKRPWQGQVEKVAKRTIKQNDPNNPLSPGAKRSNGLVNPDYTETYLFDNDFPALFDYELATDDQTTAKDDSDSVKNDLFKISPAKGSCKVMCFHPCSGLTLPTMTNEAIVKVIDKWIDTVNDLKTKYEWIQIFENKGEIMGCSNPHPHCQIWVNSF